MEVGQAWVYKKTCNGPIDNVKKVCGKNTPKNVQKLTSGSRDPMEINDMWTNTRDW